MTNDTPVLRLARTLVVALARTSRRRRRAPATTPAAKPASTSSAASTCTTTATSAARSSSSRRPTRPGRAPTCSTTSGRPSISCSTTPARSRPWSATSPRPAPNAAHRGEVESTVEVLRGRVGRVLLTTDGGACDVTVDDQPAGTTPLDGPLLVSVGPRKIAVDCAGDRAAIKRSRSPPARRCGVELKVPPAPIARDVRRATRRRRRRTRRRRSRARASSPAGSSPACSSPRPWRVGTHDARRGEQARGDAQQLPRVERRDLDRQASLTTGLAIASDVLGAASIAAVGVSTYLTIKYERGNGQAPQRWLERERRSGRRDVLRGRLHMRSFASHRVLALCAGGMRRRQRGMQPPARPQQRRSARPTPTARASAATRSCQEGVCVASGLGPEGCFAGTPQTQSRLPQRLLDGGVRAVRQLRAPRPVRSDDAGCRRRSIRRTAPFRRW